MGYDPKKWIKASPGIKDERHGNVTYIDLKIPPPVAGRHKFDFCQNKYDSMHAFLASRRWAKAGGTQGIGGAAWLELFVLYGTCGARDEDAIHIKDPKANERAEQRSSKQKKEMRTAGMMRKEGTAIVMPCLNEELTRFKTICRHIMRHETDMDQAPWFHMDQRYNPQKALDAWGRRKPTSHSRFRRHEYARKRRSSKEHIHAENWPQHQSLEAIR